MRSRISRTALCVSLLATLAHPTFARGQSATPESGTLKIEGWRLQTSSLVHETGEALSIPNHQANDWHAAVVPGTVIGTLVNDKTLPDPYYGINLRNLIGDAKFRTDKILSELLMDSESQFAVPWWYRAEFIVPANLSGKVLWLHFSGINYRAEIWVNGQQLADAGTAVGTWRVYDFDVTQMIHVGVQNAIAVKVYPPRQTDDLAISYVDWNPGFPDRYMGLFREVSLSSTGAVALRYPAVATHLDADTTNAHLTVTARLVNSSDQPQTGTLQGRIEEVQFSQPVELKPHETRDVVFDPGTFSQLIFHNSRLWWPAQMGTPNLYKLQIQFVIDGKTSDGAEKRFGIREITSQLDANDHRLFLINGKKLLIRGGGWAMDLMMQKSKQRLEEEFRYVQDMGLNTIRLEGMFETDNFFNLADEKGILVLAGWSCSLWETWPKWQKEQVEVAEQSLRSQMMRLRSHPSMLVWLNGSDNPPPPEIEKMYLAVERESLWPNPIVSSASQQETSVTGKSGVKMTGPYEYVVPEFWTEEEDGETDRGGAFGFNTETGPGPAIPPLETLEQILPKEHLWPVDDWWTFHAGLVDFKDIHVHQKMLNQRYGEAANLDDFLMKSQAMRYEAIRAMYEAFTRNKYRATGVIIWMLNNGWPSVIWNLYDYELRVGGGYFGAKRALEALHPMYGYDDHSIWVTNSEYHDASNLTLTAKAYDLNAREIFSRQANLDAPADSTNKVFALSELSSSTPVYFLKLTLHDASGKLAGSNFYWLTSKPETITHGVINISDGFAQDVADFYPLSQLPKVSLQTTAQTTQDAGEQVAHIALRNKSSSIAFFVRLNLSACGTKKEILPILWSDNYVSLLPGETREITAQYREDLAEPVRVDVSGWNVNPFTTDCP